MKRNSRSLHARCCLLLLLIVSLLLYSCLIAQAAEPAGDGQALLAKYPTLKSKLEKNQFQAPIFLESQESEQSVRVDVYGIFNYPFETVSDALKSPPDWCDITSLHINIKACTYAKVGEQWYLTLYSGRKYYQPPSDANPIKFSFHIISQSPEYLSLALTADRGPLRTRDHRIKVEAAPLEKGRTFLHFSYSYVHGAVARMAIKTYMSTIGKDKVGFTIVPAKGGKFYFIGGVRGAIERNTIRYYLALETYMDALRYPEAQRFDQRLNRWYDLTAKYPRQLKEMDKPEYLLTKRRERYNQIKLQKKVYSTAGAEPVNHLGANGLVQPALALR